MQVTLGMRQMALCIAVSTHTAASWQPWGIAPSRLRVVHNGIDTARFQLLSDADRQTERARMGLGPADHVVLDAGRLHPDKGIDVLLDAVARARGSVDKVRLVIVGGPNPSTHASRAHAESYVASLQERVDPAWAQLLPPRPEVSRLLAMADVLALPSRWPEPFPLVLLEALACGTPVVASRVGGIPELLDGAAGTALVQPDDAAALAERLLGFQGWRDSHPDGPGRTAGTSRSASPSPRWSTQSSPASVPGSHGHTTHRSSRPGCRGDGRHRGSGRRSRGRMDTGPH
ncbi:MAG: glycosyltransferase family 4 protein [Acidimicrobiales bacterium]